MITDNQLCLNWFQAIGYDTVCGYDIAPDGKSPERSDYRQIVLVDRLLAQRRNIIALTAHDNVPANREVVA